MVVRMSPLDRVRAEIGRYDHLLLEFSAEESSQGGVDLIIRLKHDVPGAHVYVAPIHARDLEHPQFTWTFQRYLYDCLHDYLCEMFTRNPQQMNAEGDCK